MPCIYANTQNPWDPPPEHAVRKCKEGSEIVVCDDETAIVEVHYSLHTVHAVGFDLDNDDADEDEDERQEDDVDEDKAKQASSGSDVEKSNRRRSRPCHRSRTRAAPLFGQEMPGWRARGRNIFFNDASPVSSSDVQSMALAVNEDDHRRSTRGMRQTSSSDGEDGVECLAFEKGATHRSGRSRIGTGLEVAAKRTAIELKELLRRHRVQEHAQTILCTCCRRGCRRCPTTHSCKSARLAESPRRFYQSNGDTRANRAELQ